MRLTIYSSYIKTEKARFLDWRRLLQKKKGSPHLDATSASNVVPCTFERDDSKSLSSSRDGNLDHVDKAVESLGGLGKMQLLHLGNEEEETSRHVKTKSSQYHSKKTAICSWAEQVKRILLNPSVILRHRFSPISWGYNSPCSKLWQ